MKRLIAKWMAHLPSNAMSRAVGWFMGIRRPRFMARFIIWIARHLLHINLTGAEIPEGGYSSANEMFTRKLVAGARPVDESADSIVSPVDASWGCCGQLDGMMAIQAKGVTYSVDRLVGSAELGEYYRDGTFATFYLCPADYHRIHAPMSGDVSQSIHIPGGLLPVFSESTQLHQDLFIRNERLISVLETAVGKVAVVKVGATSVGKITLSYDDSMITNRRTHDTIIKNYSPAEHSIKKGQELGVFNLGSTVVLLFPKGRVSLDIKSVGQPIKMGEKIGSFLSE